MGVYRVNFFKTLTNCYGVPFRVCQRSVEVKSALSADLATETAKRRFEECEGVPRWFLHADFVEVETLPPPHALSHRQRKPRQQRSGRAVV